MEVLTYFIWLAAISLSFYVLLVAKEMLLPLVVAVILWYLINALTQGFGRLSMRGKRMPRQVCFGLSIVTILGILTGTTTMLTSNIADLIDAAPLYEHNFERVISRIFGLVGMQEPPSLRQLIGSLDLSSQLSHLAVAVTGIAGNTGIILVYVLFIFLEQKSFDQKMGALVSGKQRREELYAFVRHIESDIRMYIGIKVLTSGMTGLLSYVVMRMVGLDFAEFWAILIFVFNFIPTIGSIVATIFPTLLALVQFEGYVPFFVMALGIGGLQFLIGNILEPRLMGNRLNLSPLVILLSLALWGTLWGFTGMIISVPLTAIAMIILSHFPRTRPLAILLSRRGRISGTAGLEHLTESSPQEEPPNVIPSTADGGKVENTGDGGKTARQPETP
ncbi:MAG: AI-2E family transporter [Chitinivibrionales bacterium]|nr:AI-2E family transporter [Chitinivibrionales bacterium]